MRRWIIILLIVAILGTAGFFGYQEWQRMQEANVTWQTVSVSRGDLTASVGATGTVQANQSVVVNWQTSGRVGEVFVREGDQVQANKVLATLDEKSLPQSVILARADLVTARRNLEQLQNSATAKAQALQALVTAQDELEKAQNRRESKDYARASAATVDEARANYVIAEDAVDKAEQVYNMFTGLSEDDPNRAAALSQLAAARKTRDRALANLNYLLGKPDTLEVAQADATLALAEATLQDAQREYERLQNGADPEDIEAAQARIAALEATLDSVELESPIDGTVTEIGVMPGDSAAMAASATGTGTAVAFRIDDLSRLLVDVQITEVDINRITIGQPALMSFDAIPDKQFSGKIVNVARIGQVQQAVVNFTVTIQLDDPGSEVRPGMTAAVNIITDMVESVLIVPNRAVRLVNGKRMVWVLRDNVPVMTEVELGKTADTTSELVSGDVKEGDLLVLNPPVQQNFGPPNGGGPRQTQ